MKYSHIHLLVICCFASLLVGCGAEASSEGLRQLRPVRYAEVAFSGAPESHTFSGVAQASKEAQLSFRVAGTLTRLPVQIGDRVRKGALIAVIDPIDYSIQYDQAQSQLKSAQTQVKSAQSQLVASKSNYERIEKLYENNSVPLSEFEQAKTNYEGAQSQYEAALAQVATAQKQLQSAKNQVDYTRLTAPFTGIITATMVEENEQVGAGNPIAVLSAAGNPEVLLGLPDQFISQITQGEHADITFSVLSGQKFKGTITEVGFSAQGTSTYPLVVRIDNPSPAIRPGMSADVTLYLGETEAQENNFLITPVKSVGEGPDGNFVFVLESGDQGFEVKKRAVEIRELHPGGFEVVSGLKEGEKVAIAGLSSLLDGMEVSLLEQP